MFLGCGCYIIKHVSGTQPEVGRVLMCLIQMSVKD